MRQPIVTEGQLRDLETELGRQNSKFTRSPTTEYKGDSIQALMVTNPNRCSITYQARFPCWFRQGKAEVSVGVAHWLVPLQCCASLRCE